MLQVDHIFCHISTIGFPLETFTVPYVFSAPNCRPRINNFGGFEYFENWLEWLIATYQKVSWEKDASKMLRNLNR